MRPILAYHAAIPIVRGNTVHTIEADLTDWVAPDDFLAAAGKLLGVDTAGEVVMAIKGDRAAVLESSRMHDALDEVGCSDVRVSSRPADTGMVTFGYLPDSSVAWDDSVVKVV